MANFQIPLNGSNFVNKERKQAFEQALNDDHRVECEDQEPLIVADDNPASPHPAAVLPGASGQSSPSGTNAQQTGIVPSSFDQALDHTFAHQSRTMEIHQQYLAQQADNIQLITEILTQQGKVLDQESGPAKSQIIEVFQRTLDNFHAIRKQGLLVHQEFLANQAQFSDRYLSFLESNRVAGIVTQPSPPQKPAPSPTEWVVHVPPIVLDEKAAPAPENSAQEKTQGPTREVSLADSKSGSPVSSEELSRALLDIVAEKTGYPPEMLEMNMDLEADLGIDSIKRVEILGALEDKFPSLPPADTEVLSQTRTLQEIADYMDSETVASPPSDHTRPASPQEPQAPAEDQVGEIPAADAVGHSHPGENDLIAILLDIVAEKTGYPAEMLETDMDMEADLGIDSIKRVEILGVMEERVPGLPAVDAETLAELRTLGQIAELMGKSSLPAPHAAPASQGEKKKVSSLSPQNTPVNLREVAEPDRLEIQISKDHPVVVTNDGTEFTGQLVNELLQSGWKAAIWDFPHNLVSPGKESLPEGIYRVKQVENGQDAIRAALEELRREQGIPAGFIHIHPRFPGEGLFSDEESDLVKQVFLLAGALKQDLTQLDPEIRSLFLTVTRTDGKLGFTNHALFQEGSGLTGLVKTLSLEWPGVFCRALDLGPDLGDEYASKLIIQELHDPDSGLIEVGLSKSARVTPVREIG